MKKGKLKTFLMNPWTYGIGTLLIGTVLSSKITSIVNEIKFLEGFQIVVKTVVLFFKNVFFAKVPVWSIVLGIGVVFLILLFIACFSNENNEPEKPDWHNYTSFMWRKGMKEWLLTWSYQGNRIVDLRPICSKCKCELSSDRYELYCPNCSAKFPYLDTNTLSDIEKIIDRDINTGDWIKKIEK